MWINPWHRSNRILVLDVMSGNLPVIIGKNLPAMAHKCKKGLKYNTEQKLTTLCNPKYAVGPKGK